MTMATPEYRFNESIAHITDVDGAVKTYPISASPKIAGFLMQQSAATGMLVLRDDKTGTVVCIPVARIAEMTLVGVDRVAQKSKAKAA